MCVCVSLSLSLAFEKSSSLSLSSPDDKLSENIWFVWSRTSYSGDKWLKVGRRRRCHHEFWNCDVTVKVSQLALVFHVC